ncbi:hypothetical protein CEP54_004807 [Fusarium duplospermum]|uniref:Cyanovirin-N domain-containing protein n=1 Tax=Fusarium duplospermum TaxID=1325734 RepID=A0A428QG17_9HYPO|nr:hypothetical protein CEP54_004807 [Fusarium duplospermum]
MYFAFLPLLLAAIGALSTPITPETTPQDTNSNFKDLPNTLSPDFPINETTKIEIRDETLTHSLHIRGAGGFLGSCKDVRFYISDKDMNRVHPEWIHTGYLESPRLVARCPDLTGEMKCSSLELGECMVNVNGALAPGPGGLWHKTCTQCIMKEDGKAFWCHCWSAMKGHLMMAGTTINLGKFFPSIPPLLSLTLDRLLHREL